MNTSSDRRVDIVEQGRSGSVIYCEQERSLTFHWEFGGGDVVTIVQAGDEASWRDRPWAIARRAEILRFVAAEVVRQRAPGCRAEINERSGDILLRQIGPQAPPPTAPDVTFVRRFSSLKMMLGLVVLVVALIFGGLMWFKNKVLVIDPGKGTPFDLTVRADGIIATLIQSLVPYTPSLNRDHSKDEYRMSLFLVPVDGTSSPRMIPITGALSASAFRLAKILGSDGRTLWFSVNGIGGVDLRTNELVTADELRKVNPSLDPNWWEDTRGMEVDERLRLTARDRSEVLEIDPETRKAIPVASPPPSNRSPFAPTPGTYLCSGLYATPTKWLGLHSPEEVERDFKPKSWVRRIERADEAKVMRQFFRGVLDPESSDESHRIISITPIGTTEFLNAAFLRLDDRSEPLRLPDPDGALMIYTSAPGLKGTLMVARVDTSGTILWKVDTGIDRFSLTQILPEERSMAFVGTRPMVSGKVSEPLLVIVDNAKGTVATHSLWQ